MNKAVQGVDHSGRSGIRDRKASSSAGFRGLGSPGPSGNHGAGAAGTTSSWLSEAFWPPPLSTEGTKLALPNSDKSWFALPAGEVLPVGIDRAEVSTSSRAKGPTEGKATVRICTVPAALVD